MPIQSSGSDAATLIGDFWAEANAIPVEKRARL
jgi:hypothetical protein